MAVEVYDGWYVNKGHYYFKTTDVNIYDPGDYQKYNIKLIYDYFTAQGWTLNAIAGMIGNMMVESGCNPGCCQYSSMDWDNPATIESTSGGIGLTQWTPARKYYDWAVANGLDPLSGDSQLARIEWERETNHQWSLDNLLHYTWDDYVNSTESPETLARVFVWAYERPANPNIAQRQRNARWVYDYLSGISPDPPSPPDPPEPPGPPDPPAPEPTDPDWVMGEDFAYWADQYINPENTGVPIPYSQMNDAEFVSEAWGYVSVVHQNEWYLENNAQAIWISQATYPTDDPMDESPPCPEIWFKDTITNYIDNNGYMPIGSLLFKQVNGVMTQVGILLEHGMMMTSTPEKGVYKGRFVQSYWTHFGFVCWVMPVNHYPEPPEPLSPTEIFTMWYNNRRKDVKKNVRHRF